MPHIKVDHIISFSSEDPAFVASNILSSDLSKKWKCQTVGEKTAVVVLQLEKATVISGIDIGNEHSAYIEVLVSRSGTSDDYKVLLVTSAFMTPLESRQSHNVNKVRMFTKDDLCKPECDEKWDRVKIVCTQPFNKHVQYGLSFVIFHTKDEKPTGSAIQTNIGKFAIRPESPDNLTTGSLFAKRKEFKQEEKLTAAAAIREATTTTSLARYGSPQCKPRLKTGGSTPTATPKKVKHSNGDDVQPQKDRNRNELFYSKEDDEPNEKIDRIIKRNEEGKEKQKADVENKDTEKRKEKKLCGKDDDRTRQKGKDVVKAETPGKGVQKKDSERSPSTSKHTGELKTDLKRKVLGESPLRGEKPKKKKVQITKPFGKLLEGVTVVISGIQNPVRGNLRAMAVSMGAKYKPDWEASCTHLICAFPNTPKFNQVKGKGKIVKKEWVEDCHKLRKRLPWRRYALDRSDIGQEESEEEVCEALEEQASKSDVEMNFSDHKDDGSDTEEQVARILAAKAGAEQSSNATTDRNIYNAETDDEEHLRKSPVPEVEELTVIFDRKSFYIDHSFDDETYSKLRKYIVAYKGKPVDDPTDEVDIIVTTEENSKAMKEINAKAVCVSPSWIWDCHNRKKLVSLDDYVY